MKIYSMTATFGKLSQETITLEPGLNVIYAPNEWGKSTWCAFLCAMLYGIDTRERSTLTTIADKERYAPWSGAPMSGKIDLNWNGKDITIERRTKGRAIFGDFRAYETENGMDVPDLTGENCGQMLLGVEKTVFTRSAFIRLADMPVTQDEALRRRLNALVTTGDETNASDTLAQKLKDLKNKCRHNRTGLLPQAEAQREELKNKLSQLQTLRTQVANIHQRQTDLEENVRLLENHRTALAFQASREDARRVEEANEAMELAKQTLERLEETCAALPDRDTAESSIMHLEQLRLQQDSLQSEQLPPVPQVPEAPALFAGLSPEQAVEKANADRDAFMALCKTPFPILMLLAGACIIAGLVMLLIHYLAALPFPALAVILLAIHMRKSNRRRAARKAILDAYQDLTPDSWVELAQEYQAADQDYRQKLAAYQAAADSLQQRKDDLWENVEQFTYGASISECIDGWRDTLETYQELENARQAYFQAQSYAKTLAEVVKVAQAPAFPDTLTYDAPETERLLADAAGERQRLQMYLGQCMGQMEALGQEEALTQQLTAVEARIARLEDTYQALTLALQTLDTASGELQRRFAPRIAQRAQALFHRLTNHRYDRLQLSQDLSVHAGAEGENTLHGALWRSDGTIDQLYLALRLAVTEELIPQAPLVLDDAFVRFDDDRLALAMDILKETAQQRQILLFSCQTRESGLVSQANA